MEGPRLAIRVDATKATGAGHLMRMLVLAAQWRRSEGEAHLLVHAESGSLLDRAREVTPHVHVLPAPGLAEDTVHAIRNIDPSCIVLDGYHFDTDFQAAVRACGNTLMYVDDYAHLKKYSADIILNQNYGARDLQYHTDGIARLVRGPEYVLLRDEFRASLAVRQEEPPVARNILLTLGAADTANHTGRVLKALEAIGPPLHVKVLTGALNTHRPALEAQAGTSRHRVEVLHDVRDMAGLMGWAHLALAAGGTVTWELAAMGVPTMLAVTAENQRPSVHALVRDGCGLLLGEMQGLEAAGVSGAVEACVGDQALRQSLSVKGRALVDGRGTERVVEELLVGPEHPESFRRNVDLPRVYLKNYVHLTALEHEMVRGWRNSNEVRRWMFNSTKITAEEHGRFIERLRTDGRDFYWMAVVDGVPSGSVSLRDIDYEAGTADLGIYSVRRGAGTPMLQSLRYVAFEMLGLKRLQCKLLADNRRAHEFYLRNGFREAGGTTLKRDGVPDLPVLQMNLEKEEGAYG